MKSASILGTGLIGTSIGLGLRAAGWHVTGWDAAVTVGTVALDRGGLDTLAGSEAEACAGPIDLLVLASPPAAAAAFLARGDIPWLTIDTAGAKSTILAASRVARFVGSHPMAGREVSGPEAATASLFNGATWVITTDGAADEDMREVEAIVSTLGGRPVRMSAAEHDSAVATISHLPQLLASSLVGLAGDHPEAMNLAAGSFRDLTRVAGSDPALWLDVLAANKTEVLGVISELQERLGAIAKLIDADDTEGLGTLLTSSRDIRRSLSARATAVRIALADQPGELAKVGVALSAAQADVRDIQLRHAPYGGGGVLTISVRPGDAATLTDAIVAAGLVLA
ncbi:MAG: prephenate dehydrogenase/arogenate dehydrogenase family protein [bacterium]|nr:prephenate dehydrogenase/arogenate dehydrogenase family protein [bacterium]